MSSVTLDRIFAKAVEFVIKYQNDHSGGKLPQTLAERKDFARFVEQQLNPTNNQSASTQNEGTSVDDGRRLYSDAGPGVQSTTSQIEENN